MCFTDHKKFYFWHESNPAETTTWKPPAALPPIEALTIKDDPNSTPTVQRVLTSKDVVRPRRVESLIFWFLLPSWSHSLTDVPCHGVCPLGIPWEPFESSHWRVSTGIRSGSYWLSHIPQSSSPTETSCSIIGRASCNSVGRFLVCCWGEHPWSNWRNQNITDCSCPSSEEHTI